MQSLRSRRLTFILVLLGVFLGAVLQVNAPSIGTGYGLVTVFTVLASLLLGGAGAFVAVLLGHILGLPLVLASRSMLLEVAALGALLRPVVAGVAGFLASRRGRVYGVLALAVLLPLVAGSAGILYYGDDGVHSLLAVYDSLLVLLAWGILVVWEEHGRAYGVVGLTGLLLFVVGFSFYPSTAGIAGLVGVALVLLSAAWRRFERPLLWLAAALLLVGVVAGFGGLAANLRVLGYPLSPSSYSEDRWVVPGCGNVMEGVHDPGRLRVLGCTWAEGVVDGIPFVADDGDYCFDLKVSGHGGEESLLTTGNLVLRKGRLHAEIVPLGLRSGVLGGAGDKLCRGDRVRVYGALVIDTDHGQWAEIHPVYKVELLERGDGPCVSAPSRP
ncbi:MAG: hypothetical protein F7C34_03770 [Desulfurococcales archaeon]|nr:hypothetical protein [Desulfurococcales archaeon]